MSRNSIRKYKVRSLSLGGRRNKIFQHGDTVSDLDFKYGVAIELVEKGFLEPLSGLYSKIDITDPDNETTTLNKKIIAITPFWERHKISEIFWENCNDIDLEVIAITSPYDYENEALAKKNSILTVNHANFLGTKWQSGINALREFDFNYALIIGSDDLISKKYFTEFAGSHIEKGSPYIGTLDAIAMDMNSRKFRYFPGYKNWRVNESIGTGRLISKEALECVDYQIFPHKKKGMDYYLHNRLYNQSINNILIKADMNPYRIGLKEQNSISGIIGGSPFIYDVNLEGYFSDKIIKMINNYG